MRFDLKIWNLKIIATGLSASAESVKRPSLRRNSSRVHRSSSRRNKENGAKQRSSEAGKSRSLETVKNGNKSSRSSGKDHQPVEKMMKSSDEVIDEHKGKQAMPGSASDVAIGPQDCTEMDVQTFHVTLTYKPRIWAAKSSPMIMHWADNWLTMRYLFKFYIIYCQSNFKWYK